LPASTLVVVVTLVAAQFMVDPISRGFIGRSALAASGFVANIVFWTRGGYSHLTLPEPLLHFWSLAVEEQFYLFWPVIMLIIARAGRQFRRVAIGFALVAGGVSLALCIALTPGRQPWTFYWLPARAWELLAGALMAVAGPSLVRARPALRGALGWLGLGGIVWCLFAFVDPAEGFPGYRALLPVAATWLVVLGGTAAPLGPGRLLSLPPLQWIGKRSYAIYLWHYPILVLVAAKWGPLSGAARGALLAGSVVAGAASFALLEDPVRRSGWLALRPRRSLLLGLSLAATGLAGAVVLLQVTPTTFNTGTVSAAPTLVTKPTIRGSTGAPGGGSGPGSTQAAPSTLPAPAQTNAQALVDLATANAATLEAAAQNQVAPSNLTPSLKMAYVNTPQPYHDGCMLSNGDTTLKPCEYGKLDATRTVVLFGDSHAAQWFPAFLNAANAQGWKLVVMVKKHCPAGDLPMPGSGLTAECSTWRHGVIERLKQLKPELVVMSEVTYSSTTMYAAVQGLDATMNALSGVATRLMFLGDTPAPIHDIPSCVSNHLRRISYCAASRAQAIDAARLAAQAAVAKKYQADFVTTDDWLCASRLCPVVIGNVLMYRDSSHLSVEGSKLMTPYVEALLAPYAAVSG
jgi:peptidoglycan/LPS O-acetylase OafA/YrhL